MEQSSNGQDVAGEAVGATDGTVALYMNGFHAQPGDEFTSTSRSAAGTDHAVGIESDFSTWEHLPASSSGSFTSLASTGYGGSGALNSQHQSRIVVGPRWESDVEPLRIAVRNPQRDSKLSGMKQFITYEVFSDVRYLHD